MTGRDPCNPPFQGAPPVLAVVMLAVALVGCTASGRYEAVALRIARGADELSLGNTALWQFPCLVAVHWISYKGWFAGPWRRAPHWLCYTLWGAGVALALQWAAKDFRPFVYFQF